MARKVSVVLSHWYHLVEGLQESPQKFYSSLEDAIKQRNIEKIKLSNVNYQEGGMFSARRSYFRARRKEHLFDVCAAPFGNGFFVSWWLGEAPGALMQLIMSIPIIGMGLAKLFRPITYYRYDTALMFQESIRMAVNQVIDEITKTQGLRVMSELERKPILAGLAKH